MKTEKKQKEETTETDFQGPVSLDAILAATSKNKGTDIDPAKKLPINKEEPKKEEPKKTITEPEETEEEKEARLLAENEAKKKVDTAKEEANSLQEETEAFKTATKLISLGIIQDFEIQDPENEEGSIKVSEFKQMTDANLEELVQISKQEREENISSNYISKEGIKEHQLKVIEILQNGGDLSQIAETPDRAFERPFEGFDMDDQKRQIDVIYTDLVSGKGLDHDSAIALIDAKAKKGTLEKEAKEMFDLYRNAHSKYIDSMLEEQRKEKQHKDLNFKENKKALTAKLKESGLKESVYKKVTAEYAKKNANGEHALIDKLKEALSSPEENHELILHLADKKLFNETFKIKASQEAQKTIVRLATGAAIKGNKQTSKGQKTEVEAPWLKVAQMHNDNIRKN